MVDFTKAYPSPVNKPLFADELIGAGFTNYQFQDSQFIVRDVLTEDEAAIDTVIATHDAGQLTPAQQQTTAVQDVRTNAAIVEAHAQAIAAIFNACYVNWGVSDTLDTAYTAIRSAVDSSDSAVLNRVERRLLRVYGVDAASISTDADKQAYIDNATIFTNGLMTYLIVSQL